VQFSIPNLLLIVGMVVVFLLALVAPFPHPTDEIGPGMTIIDSSTR
jgi:hypothetical protein